MNPLWALVGIITLLVCFWSYARRDFIDRMHQRGKWGMLAIILRCFLELVALCSIPVIAVSILLMLTALVS